MALTGRRDINESTHSRVVWPDFRPGSNKQSLHQNITVSGLQSLQSRGLLVYEVHNITMWSFCTASFIITHTCWAANHRNDTISRISLEVPGIFRVCCTTTSLLILCVRNLTQQMVYYTQLSGNLSLGTVWKRADSSKKK